jgi:hypothetical protein
MSSKNTSPLLSVRPRSVLASRPLLLRGEDLVLTPGAPQSTTGIRIAVAGSALSGFMPRSDTIVAKLCKPTVGLSANHHPMGGSRPMAFWGCARGHRIDPETRCCMQQHLKCLMSVWILSLEPERRRTNGPPPRHADLADPLRSVQRSSCLRLQLFGVETFLLLPECQSNGRDLSG